MRFAGPTIAATVLALLAATARADTAAVERCRQEADLERRVACLEAALAGDAATPAKEQQPTPGLAEPAQPATPPPIVERDVSEPAAVLPAESPDESASEAAGSTGESAVATRDTADIGAEQLRRNRSAAEIAADLARVSNLEVERYDEVPYQRLVIYLKNGQVWRQIEGDTQHVRATLRKNHSVDIEETSLGGYRLRLNEMRRTIRVQRVR